MLLPFLQENAMWLFAHRNFPPRAWPFCNNNKPHQHGYRQTFFFPFLHLEQSALVVPLQQDQHIHRLPQVHLSFY